MAAKNISVVHKKILANFQKSFELILAKKTLAQYKVCLAQMLSGNISPTSKAKHRQYTACLAKAKEIGISIDVSIPKWSKRGDTFKENILDKYVSCERLAFILERCPRTNQGVQLKLAIELAYNAGLRLSEVVALKKKDVVLNGHIRLQILGKGQKYRTAYLPKDKSDLLSGFQGFTISEQYIKNTLGYIQRKLGFSFSFHSLRHSFATNFLKRGGNLALLQKILGHSSLATTSIYLHCLDDSEQLSKLGF